MGVLGQICPKLVLQIAYEHSNLSSGKSCVGYSPEIIRFFGTIFPVNQNNIAPISLWKSLEVKTDLVRTYFYNWEATNLDQGLEKRITLLGYIFSIAIL